MDPHTVHLPRLHDLLDLETITPQLELFALFLVRKYIALLNQPKSELARQLRLLSANIFLASIVLVW